MGTRGGPPTLLGDLLTPKLLRQVKRRVAEPSAVERRIVEAAAATVEQPETASRLYQHTVLCQTCLPYRDPGDDTRTWERLNGSVHLKVLAGDAMHPDERRLVPVGLPFGPKARLVLMHINQLALVTGSPHIEVEDSLTAFVRRVLKLDPMGRNLRMVKEQLARLSASSITLGIVRDTPTGTDAATGYLRVVENFNVWFPKDERQRVLWPSTIDLAAAYYESLKAYAVPLDERHIAALSHSALALDIYAWLAQRLHRIPEGKPQHVPWGALYTQFGQGYDPARLDKFREKFRLALRQVLAIYQEARITEDERRRPRLYQQGGRHVWREPPLKGLILHHSPPPVPKRLQALK